MNSPACPLCQGGRPALHGRVQEYPLWRCPDCSFQYLNPQPDDAALAAIYSKDYFLGEPTEAGRAAVARMKQATARLKLGMLEKARGKGGSLLELGIGQGDFLALAQAAGYTVSGTDLSASACETANAKLGAARVRQGDLLSLDFPDASFDACVMFDVIEHPREPLKWLEKAKRLLKTGGTLFLSTPSLDSFSAALMGRRWMEYKPEHLTYFSKMSMRLALEKSGFKNIRLGPDPKILTLDYVQRHFERFPVPGFSPALRALASLVPHRLSQAPFKIVASGLSALAEA